MCAYLGFFVWRDGGKDNRYHVSIDSVLEKRLKIEVFLIRVMTG